MFADLRSFISELQKTRELCEITVPVNPYLEIAEIHRRVIAEGGTALLFRNVEGSPYPVVTNLFGTQSRVERAFGNRALKFIQSAAQLPEELMPPSLGKLWKQRNVFFSLAKAGLSRKKWDPNSFVTHTPPQLSRLPLLTTWKDDGGPFVTLPLVYTEHPETHQHNLGMYRIQRFDDQTTGLHTQIGKGGGFHIAASAELKKNLPVHVFIGGPPALILSAIAPLPENAPELILASLILGKKLPLMDNPFGPLPLMPDAEFQLIGHCDPSERRPEGPFGDHYGYYSLQHDFPVFHCQTILAKKDAIYPATVVGKPKQEDFFIGDYLQQLLSPLFPVVMPAVKDLWSYGETGYHSLAAAVVRERYKREALVSAFRILGEGQLSLTKFLLLTDTPLNLRDFRTVLVHILERADFRSDLYIFSNTAMDTLDYTGPKLNEGSKGVLLGIGPAIRELSKEFRGTLSGPFTKANVFCPGCLCIQGPSFSTDPKASSILAQQEFIRDWPLVILCDDAQTIASDVSKFLWTVFTRFDPASDIHASAQSVERFHVQLQSPVVIDARMKPSYPPEVICDPETEKLVTKRWGEYFPNGL